MITAISNRVCRKVWLAFGLALLAGHPIVIRGADWPHWRGPSRNGISAETGWRDTWPGGEPKVAWKAKVGMGLSSFIVAQGRAFTIGHDDEKDTIRAFDALSGKELWQHSYPSELGDKYFDGGTTGTPTVAGDRVFTLSRWGDVFCLEAATGKVIWSRNVQSESGAPIPDWGFSGSPLVHENLVVLNVGDAGLALDRDTGKIRWQSAKKKAGYSTALPVKRDGKWLGLLGNANSYVAVDLMDGKELWRAHWATQYGVNASDPILEGDRMFIATGYGKGGALFKLDAAGPAEIWKTKLLRTQLNAAVQYQGHLYGVDGDTTQRAALKCLDFATGEEKWAHAGFGSGGVIVVDGKLVALSGAGELLIAPASPSGFKPTARGQVLGGNCWTAPVLANGLIYCRNGRGDVAVVDVRKL